MSAIITKFICSTIMAISGLVIVKKLSNSQIKLAKFRNAILLLCVITLPITNYNVEYTYVSTISIYLMTIFAYKYILNISLIKAFTSDSILMVFMLLLDLLIGIIMSIFVPIETIRTTWYLNILSNILMSISLLLLFNLKCINNKLILFIEKIEKGKY